VQANAITRDHITALAPSSIGLGFDLSKNEISTNYQQQNETDWQLDIWKVWEKTKENSEQNEVFGNLITFYSDAASAKKALQQFASVSSGITLKTYNDKVIGDLCRASGYGGGFHFVVGRCCVNISTQIRQRHIVEALAYTIWFRLLSQPEISAAKVTRTSVQFDTTRLVGKDAPIKLGKTLYLPLSAWRKIGVTVNKNPQSELFELTYKGKTLVLSPYSEMLRAGERAVKSETAIFVEREDDGVPIEPIAAALGIRLVKLGTQTTMVKPLPLPTQTETKQ